MGDLIVLNDDDDDVPKNSKLSDDDEDDDMAVLDSFGPTQANSLPIIRNSPFLQGSSVFHVVKKNASASTPAFLNSDNKKPTGAEDIVVSDIINIPSSSDAPVSDERIKEEAEESQGSHKNSRISDSANEAMDTSDDIPFSSSSSKLEHFFCSPGEIVQEVTNLRSQLLPQSSYENVKKWPFKLDEFQLRAIYAIKLNFSVLVAAHTSAGKTAIAEYAMALALKNGQRVIYTTPIKALSNQKYQELQQSFPNESIGLLTGDVSLNKDANLIVMTTEILRSMLYHRAGELADVAWVIFDEIHYLRDAERGVVWEETIILLPKTINNVFLSATIPNAKEFAQWIADQREKPCHVVSTKNRPIPLRHYMFPAGGNGLYLVIDENGKFRINNFEAMIATFNQKAANSANNASDIARVTSLVLERKLDPVIIFSFSRKECEVQAMQLFKATNGSLITQEMQESVTAVFRNAIAGLPDSDAGLPQVACVKPLLLAGIGVHHSGMLPFLREITEMLFQEGMIRALFATETFAMGLNMPARTCVFTSCSKFDGSDTRMMTSAEYVQMSGRAGRRGLDDSGTVITIVDSRLDPQSTIAMANGDVLPLSSSFHLGYNMILNAIRSPDVDPEFIIRRSFFQFQLQYRVRQDNDRIRECESLIKSLSAQTSPQVTQYVRLGEKKNSILAQIRRRCFTPHTLIPFLFPGRIIRVCDEKEGSDENEDWGWGVVLGVSKRAKNRSESEVDRFVVDVLLAAKVENGFDPKPDPARLSSEISANESKSYSEGSLHRSHDRGEIPVYEPRDSSESFVVLPVSFHSISVVSALSIDLAIYRDLREPADCMRCLQNARYALSQFSSEKDIPELHPIRDLRVHSREVYNLCNELKSLKKEISTHPISSALKKEQEAVFKRQSKRSRRRLEGKDSDVAAHDLSLNPIEQSVRNYVKKIRLEKEIAGLGKGAQEQGLQKFREELERRKNVLRKFGYISSEDLVTTKGQVACEVEVKDDLVSTELMFAGVFSSLSPAECAALMSCLVAEETKHEPSKRCAVSLKREIEMLKAARHSIRSAEVEEQLREKREEEEINTSLMDLAFAWCSGVQFVQICAMTDMFEGSIVRSLRRLCELLVQLSRGAHSVGDEALEKKFEAAVKNMQRGIVFASSLYAYD